MNTATEQKSRPLNDIGNGERLVDRFGHLLFYVPEWKCWVCWDNTRWCLDTGGIVVEYAKETARLISQEALECSDPDRRSKVLTWAAQSQSGSKVREMVRMASTDPRVVKFSSEFDTDIWAWNCTNGTVDLRTGELRPHNKAALITKTCGIEFDPNGTCPTWENFLLWASLNRPEIVDYLQRCIGYTMCGSVSERLVIFLHGIGWNGKSTVLKTLRLLFGDYGIKVSSEVLEKSKNSSGGANASPQIADMKGARLVTTSEIEDGTKLAAALIKDITGNETLRARHLYANNEEWMPEFTPWIGANHRPTVSAEDQAVWDRLRLIPFDARWEGGANETLPAALLAEMPGILAWAIRGVVAWQTEGGLHTPDAVVQASHDYRAAMDVFSEFMTWLVEYEEYGRDESGKPIEIDCAPTPFRALYNKWAKDEDYEHMSQPDFAKNLRRRGWELKRTNRKREWVPPQQPKLNYAVAAAEAEARGYRDA